MFDSKPDHLKWAYVSRYYSATIFSTNLTIRWMNGCILYSVWALLCRIHLTASNSLKQFKGGFSLCMFYMFGRTGATEKRAPQTTAIGNSATFSVCATVGVSSKIFCGQPLPCTLKAPLECSSGPHWGFRRAWLLLLYETFVGFFLHRHFRFWARRPHSTDGRTDRWTSDGQDLYCSLLWRPHKPRACIAIQTEGSERQRWILVLTVTSHKLYVEIYQSKILVLFL